VAVVVLLERLLGSMSLKYIDFVTRVIFQSSKLIPVMIIGTLVLGKKYNWITYLSACLIIIGVISISLADAAVSPAFDNVGIVLVSLSILFEASKSILQERASTNMSTSPSRLLQWFNFFTIVFALPIAIYKGDVESGVRYFMATPSALLWVPGMFVLGFAGSYSNMVLIDQTDAFVCSLVGTFRKLLTIIFSIVYYHKPWNEYHAIGIGSAILGTFLINVAKRTRRKKHH